MLLKLTYASVIDRSLHLLYVTGASFLTINCAVLMMAFTVPGVLTLSKSSFNFNPKDTDALSKVSNQVSLLDVTFCYTHVGFVISLMHHALINGNIQM